MKTIQTTRMATKGNLKHGKYGHPIYRSWDAMKTRCYNKKSEHYPDYGGRGIIICDRWLNFSNFYSDMVSTHQEGLTIERINNDGNYEPSNCIWATRKQQNQNTRRTHFIKYKDVEKSLTDWALSLNMDRRTLLSRIKAGWAVEKALYQKNKSRNPKPFTYNK